MQKLTPAKAGKRLCELAGGQNNLARLLGLSQGTVWKWTRHGVPERFVRKIYRLFHEHLHIPISLYEIRPQEYRPTEHYIVLED